MARARESSPEIRRLSSISTGSLFMHQCLVPGLEESLNLFLESRNITSARTRRKLIRQIAPLINSALEGRSSSRDTPQLRGSTTTEAGPEQRELTGSYLKLSPAEMEAVLEGDSTLFRIYRRYKERLEKYRPPTSGIKTDEEYRAAVALVSVYETLRVRQIKLNLQPEPKPPAVATADRERQAFKRRLRWPVVGSS
jgi:hypothetical protein